MLPPADTTSRAVAARELLDAGDARREHRASRTVSGGWEAMPQIGPAMKVAVSRAASSLWPKGVCAYVSRMCLRTAGKMPMNPAQ